MDADHVDSSVQEVLNIAPAGWIPSAGWIIVGQAIDDTYGRVSANQRLNIHRAVLTKGLQGNDFELLQQLLNFWRNFRLNGADDDILAAFPAAARFIQHPEGFPYTGCIPEKDLEASFRDRGFLGLTFPQEVFGRLARYFTRHVASISLDLF